MYVHCLNVTRLRQGMWIRLLLFTIINFCKGRWIQPSYRFCLFFFTFFPFFSFSFTLSFHVLILGVVSWTLFIALHFVTNVGKKKKMFWKRFLSPVGDLFLRICVYAMCVCVYVSIIRSIGIYNSRARSREKARRKVRDASCRVFCDIFRDTVPLRLSWYDRSKYP